MKGKEQELEIGNSEETDKESSDVDELIQE